MGLKSFLRVIGFDTAPMRHGLEAYGSGTNLTIGRTGPIGFYARKIPGMRCPLHGLCMPAACAWVSPALVIWY